MLPTENWKSGDYMGGRFEYKYFRDIDVADPFFGSLKQDYEGFETEWFPKCAKEGRQALVFSDEHGLGAFVAMKQENEPILLKNGEYPAVPRLKVCTLLLAERFRGQRLGEGAIGLVLWKWQELKLDEVYVTVYPSHADLISQLRKFGFIAIGYNPNGELVFIRSRKSIDFSDPYKAFPFVNPKFRKGGYVMVNGDYHDTLFPYSELKNTLQEQLDKDVANGITKVYVGQQYQTHYQRGEPVFIYRIHPGSTGKKYRSCITSYCVIDEVITIKRSNRCYKTFEEFGTIVGNKSVFTQADLRKKYTEDKNITVIRMLYCGYFGAGNNVTCDWLGKNGLWSPSNDVYPANIQLTPRQCAMIWQAGEVDVCNAVGR